MEKTIIGKIDENGIINAKVTNHVAWESVLESRIYSTFEKACKSAELYCRLNDIIFRPEKHINLVFLWLD